MADQVPQTEEERQVVRFSLLDQAKAAILAGRFVEAQRAQLASLNFAAQCQLHDARLDENTPPEELSELENEVRVSTAGLKTLAAAAAAAGER